MITDKATLNERRIQLRDQLLIHGPEKTDMLHWFTRADTPARPWMTDDIRLIDIEECGTTACLAGHGALVMLPEVAATPFDVAKHFGVDSNAFFHEHWKRINVGSDFNMRREYNRQRRLDSGKGTVQRCRWRTLISYLDALIKRDAE